MYAHVRWPLMSNHVPPGHSAAESNGEPSGCVSKPGPSVLRANGSVPSSLTLGSKRDGVMAVPNRDGPFGAPMPSRNLRMFATSVFVWDADGAPARIAHGCGSPMITPLPTCLAPL